MSPMGPGEVLQALETRRLVTHTEREELQTWVNILPKNPYLAKLGVLEKLILLKSKKDDFREN